MRHHLSKKVGAGQLVGGVPEVVPGGRNAADLADAEVGLAGGAEGQGVVRIGDEDDLPHPSAERHGRRREGPKDVYDYDGAGRLLCAFEEAADRDLHGLRERGLIAEGSACPVHVLKGTWASKRRMYCRS